MWSKFILIALLGFAAASDLGWKSNTEYIYKVRGRTLTGLHEVANQYAGVLMNANLIVRPESDGRLMARISDAKYAKVHTQLPEGWHSEIPESKLNFEKLPLNDKPFEIILKNGIVRDIIVSKDVHNWEANLIKSIVSQIQLDTQAEHVIKSHINQLPEEDSNSAVYKTMEDTITGKYETLYEISPLPKYILQSQPWLVPMPQMLGDGEFIEIVKSKNFSRGEERVGYHFGLGGNLDWDPSSNQMGEFFLRTSNSRAVITGNLKRYTIQSSVTTNKIILSPTLNSEQKGMVVSFLNLTLAHVQPASSQFEKLHQPQHLGNLVYTYNTPFSGNHETRQGQQRRDSEEYNYSSEEHQYKQNHYRHRRSVSSSEEEYDLPEMKDSWTQETPKLHEAPECPMLQMFIGYQGKSIKQSEKIEIVHAVEKICQQIGHELQRPEQIPKEQTLAKFTILTHLVRIMNEKEMKEVIQKLYTREVEGPKVDAWYVYRDALAECGTGPALLVVKELIQSQKIQMEEAAEVIATMAESAQQPTPEYMHTFFSWVTNEEIRSQPILNDTAILAFSNLVRKVYVNREYSQNEYPIESFGSFRRIENSREFVHKEVIEYLKEKLQSAVEKADSHKVLVYIRALGNVADQKIMPVFEPYLEGEKQMSQFQRLQIVLALDKLVQIHPKKTRSVLFKIYQNIGEMSEIRAAAVYQLMRTTPPASMLQRMATYTNVDVQEQVNSAVKSSIETAATLEGEQHAELSANARAALPLLTKDQYGIQYSSNFLRSYVVDEMNLMYKQKVNTLGSSDSWIPKGIKYYLRSQLGGFKDELINVQAVVSSVEELTNILAQQTEIHQQMQKQQKQNYRQAEQNQWSSEAIAKLLNIKTEEREQFEGSLLLQLGGGASRFFSINNQTLEMLPQVIRDIEEVLRSGKNIHFSKFLNRQEIIIGFPTEMSLPFVYTLNVPTLMHVKGQIHASAEPKISSGDKLHKPHTIKAKSEIRAILSTKIEAKLGFVTPFDHQEYISGYDKNVQLNIPVKFGIEIDIKNKQVEAQIEPIEQEKSTEILHFSTWPYTAKYDILSLEPVAKISDSHLVQAERENPVEFENVFGRSVGFAFRVKYASQQKFLDARWVYEQLSRHDAISALMVPMNDETLAHVKLQVELDSEESSSRKLKIRMGYEKRHESEETNESSSADISQFSQLPHESKARQHQFAKMASSGIRNAEVGVYDVAAEFDGQNNVEYTVTLAVASGSADEKSRVLFYLRKHSKNHHESLPFQIAMAAKARVPTASGLDFIRALKFDPTTTAQIELAFGQDYQSSTKVEMKAVLRKSESRRQYLQHLYRAKECRREMEEGNKQLSACINMTAEANLLDRVQVQLRFKDLSPRVRNMTYHLYNAVSYMGYYNLEENMVNPHGSGNQEDVELEARFEPDFESVNVTLRAEHLQAHFDNVRVNEWVQRIVAVHPVFPVSSRIISKALELDTYRPFCVVDQSAANTFDNKTYPIELPNAWTVMMQYVPSFARQSEHHQQYQRQQEEQQLEQYIVLVRDTKTKGENKEVKLTLRTPETQGQLVEIDLKPVEEQQTSSGSNPSAKVYVNQKQYKFSDKKNVELEDGLINIYALPEGEVILVVRDNFYIVFDGERVRIGVLSDKFRGSIRGLCGTFTGEEYSDFLTPKNCILRKPEEFVATYAIEQKGRVGELQSLAEKSPCNYDQVYYANVVSDYDTGRHYHPNKQENQGKSHSQSKCIKHQTRYVVDKLEDKICFTVKEVPICKGSCNYIKKNVPVHCVQKSSVADLWVQQIKKGASPDFSHKSATRSLEIEIPESCSRY